ncbi:MAG: hypothetical protein P4L56_21430 [Candidatus Sulfopaludibacter sp.]|nr:hypothetical protein [Candidatus Sulfopaludibacter sp.]
MRSIFTGAVFIFSSACALFGQTPVVAEGGVLNGASFVKGQAVAPGSLVSIFGTNLASANALANSIPISTTLANSVTVTFNGVAAPLLGVFHDPVNGDQINAQLPWEVSNGTANVVVNNSNGSSAPVGVNIGPSPGIFASGTQAIAYGNSDGIIAAANGSIPGLTTHPAKINDPATLVILATGLGPVNPPVQTGNIVTDNQVHNTTTTPTVTVGNVPAQVVFSGMTPQFVGVYQINIIIAPGTPTGDAIPLQITMSGITTPSNITIAVSN